MDNIKVKKDPLSEVPAHDFLFNHRQERLAKFTETVPMLRQNVESLPKTSAMFTLSRVVDRHKIDIDETVMQLVGSWKVPELFQTRRATKFVNPSSVHAKRYTDVFIKCECDAYISRAYDDDFLKTDIEHEHSDDCLPYHRLHTRAKLQEKRHEVMLEGSWLGMRGKRLAQRLGVESDTLGSFAKDFGTSMTELRDRYRIAVAKTAYKARHEYDITHRTMAKVYGHDASTIGRWIRMHDQRVRKN